MARPVIVKILGIQIPPNDTFTGATFATNVVGSDYILTTSDFAVGFDATAADPTNAQLPPATGSGRMYYIYKVDVTANTVDVLPDGADLINGSILVSLQDQYSDCLLMDVVSGNWANMLS